MLPCIHLGPHDKFTLEISSAWLRADVIGPALGSLNCKHISLPPQPLLSRQWSEPCQGFLASFSCFVSKPAFFYEKRCTRDCKQDNYMAIWFPKQAFLVDYFECVGVCFGVSMLQNCDKQRSRYSLDKVHLYPSVCRSLVTLLTVSPQIQRGL